jgi:hypothetical protein
LDPRSPRIPKLTPWTVARFEWADTDAQLRAFLKLTHQWVDPRYEQIWDAIGHRPGGPDDSDQADIFFEETGGLWPGQYDWLLHGLLVRDAVSAFEVYLEKAANELLRSQGFTWQSRGRTVSSME